MVFWSCLLLLFLWLRVSLANLWTIEVPTSVLGLSGSCVVIPCTFIYPAQGKTYKTFTGIWTKGNDETRAIYHSNSSVIIDAFKGRTNLTGDLHQNNCSLKISSLRSSDAGLLKFRIEIKDFNNYTYEDQKVSLKVEETPVQPTISVEEELTSGKPVNVTCTVSYFCPSDLPTITWSHNGIRSSPSQTQTHTLTFTPSREDHNKNITCSAAFKEKKVTAYKTLKVKSTDSNPRFANNSLGNSSLTLEVPQNAMLYIYASVASAIVAVLAGIVICVVRRHRKEVKDGDEDIYTNCPSGLVNDNWGCNQKPLSLVSTFDDEQIYANA